MEIRKINLADIEQLRVIWAKHYANEFEFPQFAKNFVQTFLVEDSNNRIITGGGIRLIAESVLITNKDYPILERRDALEEVLNYSLFACGKLGYDQLHAFVQNDSWKKVLMKYDFRPCVGEALVKDV